MTGGEKALLYNLRSLARMEHADLSIGDEAADAIERIARERDDVLAREAATQARHDARMDAVERERDEAGANVEKLRSAIKLSTDLVCSKNGFLELKNNPPLTFELITNAYLAYRATNATSATPPAHDMVLVPREPTEAMKIAALAPRAEKDEANG
jgi:hypothetical protein